MPRREAFPIIASRDLRAARVFYERVFGGSVEYAFPPDGEDPVYLTLRVGDGQVALADGTGPNAYGERPLPATGHPVDLCIYVDDLDAALEAAPTAGGALVVEAADMPWGERVGWVRDPDGVHILVIQGD